MKSIIIGAESDLGLHVDGTNLAARVLINELKNNKFLYIKPKANACKNNVGDINNFNTEVYNTIINNKNYFPIMIGGDHSISVASALASQNINHNIGVIWFDAHPDFNTFETTITGNIHGLPLATIAGYNNSSLRIFHNNITVNPENIVVVGARSIDKLEMENLKNANIKIFTTNDIKNLGIEFIIKEALKIAGNNTNGIHISYDLDVIDPIVAPGVSIPEINGISEEEAMVAHDLMLNNKKVVSFDLVEYNPLKDIDNKTKNIALNILNNTLKIISKK